MTYIEEIKTEFNNQIEELEKEKEYLYLIIQGLTKNPDIKTTGDIEKHLEDQKRISEVIDNMIEYIKLKKEGLE